MHTIIMHSDNGIAYERARGKLAAAMDATDPRIDLAQRGERIQDKLVSVLRGTTDRSQSADDITRSVENEERFIQQSTGYLEQLLCPHTPLEDLQRSVNRFKSGKNTQLDINQFFDAAAQGRPDRPGATSPERPRDQPLALYFVHLQRLRAKQQQAAAVASPAAKQAPSLPQSSTWEPPADPHGAGPSNLDRFRSPSPTEILPPPSAFANAQQPGEILEMSSPDLIASPQWSESQLSHSPNTGSPVRGHESPHDAINTLFEFAGLLETPREWRQLFDRFQGLIAPLAAHEQRTALLSLARIIDNQPASDLLASVQRNFLARFTNEQLPGMPAAEPHAGQKRQLQINEPGSTPAPSVRAENARVNRELGNRRVTNHISAVQSTLQRIGQAPHNHALDLFAPPTNVSKLFANIERQLGTEQALARSAAVTAANTLTALSKAETSGQIQEHAQTASALLHTVRAALDDHGGSHS